MENLEDEQFGDMEEDDAKFLDPTEVKGKLSLWI